MYYPEDMTKEDIQSFELDMSALTLREEELGINWELQMVAEDAMMVEHSHRWADMVRDICVSSEDVYGWH